MLHRDRSLGPLFAPASVAIVGASHDPGKWGGLLARGALKGAGRRTVQLVNRDGGKIFGQPAFPSLFDLAEAPELVVACVPPGAFAETVAGALEVGARAIVGISAGIDEPTELAAAARVRAAGSVLLGPNCLGVYDRDAELDLAPWVDFPPGEIGLIAQSGNLSLELALLAHRDGVGFSRFASLGNQADLDAAVLLAHFAGHEATRVIALYVEDFRDGRAFVHAAAEAGKPVVLLTAGTSEAGARAARSHTRALASDLMVIDAACRAAGIVRVSTPRELIDAAKALLSGARSAGRRVVVLGDGGGHGVVAADVVSREGLVVPQITDALAAGVAAVLPATASTHNPIDFAGGAEQDVRCFERVGRLVLDSGEADALLVTGYFGGYDTDAERETASALAAAARAVGVPLVVHSLYPQSETAAALVSSGALVYGEIESASRALAVLARTPEPAFGLIRQELGGEVPPLREGYFESRRLAATAGIRMAEARPAATLDEARAAADELGYPVVLKSLAAEHKSDAGGVVLGIPDADALDAAYAALPGGACSVERMVDTEAGVELIVGVRRDPRFGPVLVVGLGGIRAELLRDVALALAPVEPAAAERLIRSLRCAPFLTGMRGRPALNIAAAAQAASALSQLASRAPWLAELEVNPLLVTADDAVGLDARLVLATMEQA